MIRTALFLLLASGLSLGADTAMFRANPQHSGVYEAKGVPKLVGVKWKFKTHGQVYGTPAIADGVLYIGSTDHHLYALDLESGAVKWKFKSEGRVASSAAVSGGVVYFASYDGNFYALNAADGSVKWKFKTGGERRFAAKHLHGSQPATETMPDPFDFFLSSPAVLDGTVYFGSGDGNVYALNAADGSVKWKFQTGDVVHASPAIADGTLYIGSWDSYFYALDTASGKEKWRFKTGEDHDIYNQVGIQGSAAVADGTVYFGCRDSKLYAVDAQSGKEKWRFDNHGSWVINSPALRDGKVYFATSDSGMIYALDGATGKTLYSMNAKKWPMFSSPAIAGNTVYIGSHDGTLRAFDLASGNIAWSFQTDGAKENLAGLLKEDGTPKYEAAFFGDFYDDMVAGVQTMAKTGMILSSPVVVGDAVYFGSADGNVYAVK